MNLEDVMLGRTIHIAPSLQRMFANENSPFQPKDAGVKATHDSKACVLRRLPSLHSFEHALTAPPLLVTCSALPSSKQLEEYQWNRAEPKSSPSEKRNPTRKHKHYKVRKLAKNPNHEN